MRCKTELMVWMLALGLMIAAPPAAADMFAGFRGIKQLYPHDGGLIFFLDGDIIDTNSSCPNRFSINAADPVFEVKVSGLMTAYATSMKVNVNYDESYTECNTPVNRFIMQK